MQPPTSQPLRYGESASTITHPAWLLWFQQTFDIGSVAADRLAATSGTNTGDQDLSQWANTSGTNTGDQDLSQWANTSGTNTGDQDLSGIETALALLTTIQILGDATAATYNANLLAATDPTAPAYYEVFKVDGSANSVVVTPASGTVQGQTSISLDVQGQGVRLARNSAANDWMKF